MFCEGSHLTITNSLFQHASRHITTWQGYINNPDGGSAIPIYNQIDYITISSRYVGSVRNSRTWAGCCLPSDHSLVTIDLTSPVRYWHRKRVLRMSAISTETLCKNSTLQAAFSNAVSKQLPSPLMDHQVGMSWEQYFAVLLLICSGSGHLGKLPILGLIQRFLLLWRKFIS